MPKKRVRIHRTVLPETVKLMREMARVMDLTEGRVLDRAVQALAQSEEKVKK